MQSNCSDLVFCRQIWLCFSQRNAPHRDLSIHAYPRCHSVWISSCSARFVARHLPLEAVHPPDGKVPSQETRLLSELAITCASCSTSSSQGPRADSHIAQWTSLGPGSLLRHGTCSNLKYSNFVWVQLDSAGHLPASSIVQLHDKRNTRIQRSFGRDVRRPSGSCDPSFTGMSAMLASLAPGTAIPLMSGLLPACIPEALLWTPGSGLAP